MQISCRLLSGTTFNVEIDIENDKVNAIKDKIAENQKYVRDGMKILYGGKVLTDEQTLKDAEFIEGKFIVVVPGRKRKKKVKKAKKTEETPTANTTEESQTPAPTTVTTTESTPTPNVETTPSTDTTTETNEMTTETEEPTVTRDTTEEEQAPQQTAPTQEEIPERFKANVDMLVDMGFPDKQFNLKCLICTDNDISAATEFAINGHIPPQIEHIMMAQHRRAQGGPQAMGDSQNPLMNLMGLQVPQYQMAPQDQQQQQLPINPDQFEFQGSEFDNIRQSLQENPELLQIFLEGLLQSQPERFVQEGNNDNNQNNGNNNDNSNNNNDSNSNANNNNNKDSNTGGNSGNPPPSSS